MIPFKSELVALAADNAINLYTNHCTKCSSEPALGQLGPLTKFEGGKITIGTSDLIKMMRSSCKRITAPAIEGPVNADIRAASYEVSGTCL